MHGRLVDGEKKDTWARTRPFPRGNRHLGLEAFDAIIKVISG